MQSFNGNENWFAILLMHGRRSRSGGRTTTKSVCNSLQYRTPVEFAAPAAGYYRNEVGQEASNAYPLPAPQGNYFGNADLGLLDWSA